MVLKVISKRHRKVALNEVGSYVLSKRYLLKDDKGKVIETPQELFTRVAGVIASAEKLYDSSADTGYWGEKFYKAMSTLEFLPNSPALLNAGCRSGMLAACSVLQLNDSLDEVIESLKKVIILHQAGAGTGFNLSRIRPEGDKVNGQQGVACGPARIVDMLSTAANIRQGGIRQGCNSTVIDVSHPDVMQFIDVKKNDNGRLRNFYTSIAVTDDFMRAVSNDGEHHLINPRTKEIVSTLKAREIFDRIVDQAWSTGEPGITFIDRVGRDNPTPQLGDIDCISGCGEQFLLPYESCPLGSINLTRSLSNGNRPIGIDYPKLGKTVHLAVRFLDNLIDVSQIPLREVKEISLKTRKIGLGVMGFADTLIHLGIPYDSEEAVRVAEEVMSFIKREAHKASEELAKERGAFPAFKGSSYDRQGKPPLRNATLTTISPTGTISLIAGCSNGIEPLFSTVCVWKILDGQDILGVNSSFKDIALKENFLTKEILKKLVAGCDVVEVEEIPDRIRRLLVTAHKIDYQWHLRIQAAFQKYVDNSISKTINLPHGTTQEEVAQVFKLAWLNGLKGVTVYRDGSRKLQPWSNNGSGPKLVDEYWEREGSIQTKD
jgi:ribonucleoside-diphosphate reductase alpha chain